MIYSEVDFDYTDRQYMNYIFRNVPNTFTDAKLCGNTDHKRYYSRLSYCFFFEDPMWFNPYYDKTYQLRQYDVGEKFDMLIINNFALYKPELTIDYCDVNFERAIVSINAIFGRLHQDSCYPIKYRILYSDQKYDISETYRYYYTLTEEERFDIGNSFEKEFIYDEFIKEFKEIYHNFVRIDFFIEYYGK